MNFNMANKKYDLEKNLMSNSDGVNFARKLAEVLKKKYPNKCEFCGKEKQVGKPCNCMFEGVF